MLRLGAVAFGVVAVVGLAAGRDTPPAGDLGVLQGYWKPLSMEYQGKDMAVGDELQKITVVFDGNEQHLYYKKSREAEPIRLALMTVTVDGTTSPKTIHLEFAAGPLKGQKRHGIFEVSGNNQLKMCYGPADKPKPTTFTAPAGSGYFLEVWGRQPK